MLPAALEDAIARELATVDARDLASAVRRLTERYKRGEFSTALRDAADRAAYLAVRFPATYAASCKAFGHVRERVPHPSFTSLLDLGAGAGAAAWAAAGVLGLETVTCIEHNAPFAEMGKRIAVSSQTGALGGARWLPGDICEVRDLPAHDVVVLSYVLGELTEPRAMHAIGAAWLSTRALLVAIEPGTPEGFRRLHEMRALLLQHGAYIVAPCPHHDTCPMFASADWCHFAARLERTARHRRLKGGSLGYEDEKFSYIAVARQPVDRADSRVLRHPQVHAGHLRLTLCRPARPELRTVTRSHGPLWRYTRKLEWGDAWEPPESRSP